MAVSISISWRIFRPPLSVFPSARLRLSGRRWPHSNRRYIRRADACSS